MSSFDDPVLNAPVAHPPSTKGARPGARPSLHELTPPAITAPVAAPVAAPVIPNEREGIRDPLRSTLLHAFGVFKTEDGRYFGATFQTDGTKVWNIKPEVSPDRHAAFAFVTIEELSKKAYAKDYHA